MNLNEKKKTEKKKKRKNERKKSHHNLTIEVEEKGGLMGSKETAVLGHWGVETNVWF